MSDSVKDWILGPSDELAIAEGCRFDIDRGLFVCDYVETFCKQSKGKWAGVPLALMEWQRNFILRLYSWIRPDGSRRYRSFYLEMGKKNGKTTILAGLSTYHLLGDGEAAPEVYINASDRSQASILFEDAERMIEASPSFKSRLKVIPSAKRIVEPVNHGKIQALSADVPSKDGLNPSLTIFDELHRQRTPDMWNIFRHAGAARRQPLLGAITTAGYDRESICYKQHVYTQKVNAGLIPDTSHLGVIYGATIEDDWEDPATWRKANPSLGVTLSEDEFRDTVKRIKESPEELNNFLRLRLCIWTQASRRWISREAWDACGGSVDAAQLIGRRCWAGLDLSSTKDLTALALIFESGEILCWFWAPEESADRRQRLDRVPYDSWARLGAITLTPGAVIDYSFPRNTLKRLGERYQIEKVVIDPHNATQLALELRDSDGFKVEFLRQGFLSLSAPTKELDRLIHAKKIRHGDNPILNWCADNAVAEEDAAGNIKISKDKSTEKIDGIAALINAISGRLQEVDSGESVYDSRGLLFI